MLYTAACHSLIFGPDGWVELALIELPFSVLAATTVLSVTSAPVFKGIWARNVSVDLSNSAREK